MKNRYFRRTIFRTLAIVVVLFASVNASFMTGMNKNIGQYERSNPTVQNAPSAGGCQIFPQNNFWNVPVDNLPLHSMSAAWINSIGRTQGFHMDFGSGTWDGGPIGIPYNIISGSQVPHYTVDFYFPDDSDAGPYPIPATPAIEYGSDHHILSIDREDCRLYEIYDASKNSGLWSAGSGAIWDMHSNALRPDGWTSADAAGLPIFAGLARYEEVAAGKITHALRFTTECTGNYYIWPARHVAPHGSCTTPVPFGARFRLKAAYDISDYSPPAQIILQAMKTYGIVLADNGSPWYVSGAPSESWDNDVLHELDAVTGNDFEAVNTSGLMVDINSGKTNVIPVTFMDVPDSHPYWEDIEILYANGLTAGCSLTPLNFCPDQFMDRAQSAVFNLRGNYGTGYASPAAPWNRFADDWSAGTWAERWAEGMYNAGLTAGCATSPLRYCPWDQTPRAQAAVFGLKLKYGNSYAPPAATGTVFFDMTDTAYFGTKWAEKAYADGLLPDCGTDIGSGKPLFCPNDPLSRGLGAYMIVRARNLTMP
jgi:hypothetical protein